jgi:multiple sugar transport system substrate-binding protein/putative aldouronate transport system substrate-binding protein
MLYNVGPIFDAYASSQVKGIFKTTKGKARGMVTVDGKMVGIPSTTVMTNGVEVMNVQKNWLDQYGLAVPKTVGDIEKVAQVFKDKQPAGKATIPIIGPDKGGMLYSTWIASSDVSNSFDPIFSSFDVYPGYFLDNGDGTCTYGSLDPNMKKPLALLAKWYKEGLIDPEMGVRDNSAEPVNANQAGIRFAPWWCIGYGNGDSYKNNPKVNWQAYPVYTDDGKWYTHMKATGTSACIINKKASPDAVAAIVIMSNAYTRDEGKLIPTTDEATDWYPIRTIMAAADECEYEYAELTKVLEGKTKPEDYNTPMSMYKLMYEDAQHVKATVPGFKAGKELATTDFSMANENYFYRMIALLVGDRPYATVKPAKEVYSVTYSPTESLQQYWPQLWKMEQEVMMQIVTGKQDLSAFDKFCKDWKTQGGDAVLKDVAETYLKK